MIRYLILALLVIGITACDDKKDKSSNQDSVQSAPFTANDLSGKSYKTACIAGNDPLTGAGYRRSTVVFLNTTTYNSADEWFTSASCTGGSYTVVYATNGTYALSTSGSPQPIVFNVTSSDMMAMSNATQTATNTACGGTSPYSGGVSSGNNGQHHSTYMMSCTSITLPNSGNRTVSNVSALNDTTLTLGVSYAGIPGSFSASPATATVNYEKQ